MSYCIIQDKFAYFKPIHYILYICYLKSTYRKDKLGNCLIYKEIYTEPDLNNISLIAYSKWVCGVKRNHLLKVDIRFSLLEICFSVEKERLLFPTACGYIN